MNLARLILATAFLAAAAQPVLAHHSFVAEYDYNKRIELTGTVTKLEWTNPHGRFFLRVEGKGGASTVWQFELGSPNALLTHGWRRDTLKVGDRITVNGYLSKGSPNVGNAAVITFPDGRKVAADGESLQE